MHRPTYLQRTHSNISHLPLPLLPLLPLLMLLPPPAPLPAPLLRMLANLKIQLVMMMHVQLM